MDQKNIHAAIVAAVGLMGLVMFITNPVGGFILFAICTGVCYYLWKRG
jgi:hypothetical protein